MSPSIADFYVAGVAKLLVFNEQFPFHKDALKALEKFPKLKEYVIKKIEEFK